MKPKHIFWILGAMAGCLLWAGLSSADTSTSTTTLTIDPAAVSGASITAADENDRSSDTSTWANAHVHSLSNTTNFGDGAAGDKQLCADAADATDVCIQFDDSEDLWTLQQGGSTTYSAIVTASNTAGLITYGDFSARAYNSGAIAITSGTATVLTLDNERWDTDTIHDTSSNTSRLTATTAGRYQATCHVEWAANTIGWRRLEIQLNGATVIASDDMTVDPLDDEVTPRQSLTVHYDLSATDYLECYANQTGSDTLNVNATSNVSPEFSMVKVP